MNFRRKTALLVIAMTAITMGAAFAVVWRYFVDTQREQLDAALLAVAHREASEAATGQLEFTDAPGPSANAVGPLPKYGAIYTMYGVPLSTTSNFQTIPEMPRLAPFERCFDFDHDGTKLRAVIVEVPKTTMRVLLAAPRADLEDDARLLGWAMTVAFAVGCAWAGLVASFVAARLTRNYRIVEAVARRVADGDISARVAFPSSDDDLKPLADDINSMIDRLVGLAATQDRFVAHAAHELRTPLTSLRIELEHALRTARDRDEYEGAMRGALDSARKLSVLVEDLLVVARAKGSGSAGKEVALLEDCFGDAVADVGPFARTREVRIEVVPVAVNVRAERRSLARVLRNLLENAVRFSPSGGTVRVDAELRSEDVRIVVSDEGPGIARADRERMFEPFERADGDADHPGAGLGLSIARSLARSFRGDVTIEDGPGGRVVVHLPVSREPLEDSRDSGAPPAPVPSMSDYAVR
ncbi:ATP-binding protein [Pendulispora albinea]|uniref:histidine kinase n=1 Tax=Pendulispora albinea TaxID=2741071 RepID=A0ABZ2MA20_9BACT